MKARGIETPADLARLTGLKESSVRSNVNGTRGFSNKAAEVYARALRVDPAWLQFGKAISPSGLKTEFPVITQDQIQTVTENLPSPANHEIEPSNIRMATAAPDVRSWMWSRDVAVMGTSQCGDDGAFEINSGEPIKFVPRPPSLSGVKGVYAIYAEGDSMIPAFKPGALVYVHTRLQLIPDCHVVVQLKPEHEGDTPRAYLKTLISKGIGGYRVKQWNPDREIVFPIEQVLTIHRVLTLEELLSA